MGVLTLEVHTRYIIRESLWTTFLILYLLTSHLPSFCRNPVDLPLLNLEVKSPVPLQTIFDSSVNICKTDGTVIGQSRDFSGRTGWQTTVFGSSRTKDCPFLIPFSSKGRGSDILVPNSTLLSTPPLSNTTGPLVSASPMFGRFRTESLT